MGPAVYILGMLTSTACAFLLWRGYARGKKKLLLWSGLCFAGFAFTHVLVFVDLVLFPELDLYVYRLAAATVALGLLIYGLIWESNG
jgi:hypothetical protein